MIAWPLVALLVAAALVIGACLGVADAIWLLRRDRHRRVVVEFTSPEARRALGDAMRDELADTVSNVVRLR